MRKLPQYVIDRNKDYFMIRLYEIRFLSVSLSYHMHDHDTIELGKNNKRVLFNYT